MHRIKAVAAILGFALTAIIFLPLVAFDFTAENEQFPAVTVYDSGYSYRYESAAQSVGELFNDIGIATEGLDRINYPMESPLYDGMDIRVNRAVRFDVVADSGPPTPWVMRYGTTVEDILLYMQDTYEVPFLYANDLTRRIESEDVLHFSSWKTRYYTEIVEVPYQIIENHTDSVRTGRTHIRQHGMSGEHEITVNVVYIGGEENSRTITDTVVIAEPVYAIYDIGTATLGALANTSAPDFHFNRRIRMQATAYCACVICTGKNPGDPWHGITASGRQVEHGIVAVDRDVIPLGTHLYVEGYGFAIAADTGGAIIGDKIDLYMYCHQEALRFGRRYLNVWVLS
ncbi:MAG: 3D domain-containing protein [Defluviitaleaceae bacterium]|nr:3D domain-containing protein [Defluviitaleaceae bacterium]